MHPFAIASFEDGLAIVRSSWIIFDENGKFKSSYYPALKDGKSVVRCLLSNEDQDFINSPSNEEKWKNYYVLEFLCYAGNYIFILKSSFKVQ